jgi:ligand-binding SRPBCC domain-containing protein
MAEGMIQRLLREQLIPASLETVWAYFCDPKNLNKITPPDMNFEIVAGGEEEMYAGQLIEYRVEFVRGIRSRWLTEIAHVKPYVYFVDEQRVGPYRFWYHQHKFDRDPAGVKMTDLVSYVAPFGILGDAVNSIWIRRRLETIFDFRREKISELFGSAQ